MKQAVAGKVAALSLILFITGCSPVTVVRNNVSPSLSIAAISKSGLVISDFKINDGFKIASAADRESIEAKWHESSTNIFAYQGIRENEAVEKLKPSGLDGDFLAALNQYETQGSLRNEVFDKVMAALNVRYLMLGRAQYSSSNLDNGFLIFKQIESNSTIEIKIYDSNEHRVVAEVIANGSSKKGLFGGSLSEGALRNAIETGMTALQADFKQ